MQECAGDNNCAFFIHCESIALGSVLEQTTTGKSIKFTLMKAWWNTYLYVHKMSLRTFATQVTL